MLHFKDYNLNHENSTKKSKLPKQPKKAWLSRSHGDGKEDVMEEDRVDGRVVPDIRQCRIIRYPARKTRSGPTQFSRS